MGRRVGVGAAEQGAEDQGLFDGEGCGCAGGGGAGEWWRC